MLYCKIKLALTAVFEIFVKNKSRQLTPLNGSMPLYGNVHRHGAPRPVKLLNIQNLDLRHIIIYK